MATTIDARRTPVASERVAAAHSTSARHWTGMPKKKISIPWPAFAIDGSTTHRVAYIAGTVTTKAPIRSTHGARLNSSHHTATTSPMAIPANMPYTRASGTRTGTTNHASHCTVTATTPGHSRSGFSM